MNILWIKDNNVGHEKQVKVLLDELSKTRDIKIIQINVKEFEEVPIHHTQTKHKTDII